MKINDVTKVIKEFSKKTIGNDAQVIQVTKEDDGWLARVVVFEESAFIKSVGLSTNVQDRNIYEIKLNDELKVVSYSREKGTNSE